MTIAVFRYLECSCFVRDVTVINDRFVRDCCDHCCLIMQTTDTRRKRDTRRNAYYCLKWGYQEEEGKEEEERKEKEGKIDRRKIEKYAWDHLWGDIPYRFYIELD